MARCCALPAFGLAVLSPDQRSLLTCDRDGRTTLHRIDPAAGRVEGVERYPGHLSGVSAMSFDHDHLRLLTGGHDHGMHLWEVDDDGLLRFCDPLDDGAGVHSARWSPDDRVVARTASDVDQLDILAVHD